MGDLQEAFIYTYINLFVQTCTRSKWLVWPGNISIIVISYDDYEFYTFTIANILINAIYKKFISVVIYSISGLLMEEEIK